jgi:hypothetical protein
MTPIEESVVKTEFRNFCPPHKFRGGCLRSTKCPDICVHLTHEGRIGMFEEGCTSQKHCQGRNFKFNP